MRLEKLISLLKQKESKRLEFKKFRDEISATLFETVCAFLNRDGGEIIIGADDDGKIIGIEESRIDRMMNNIVTMSNNPDIVDPPFILDPHKYEIEGKSIIYLNIPESSQVHRFKGTVYDRSSDGDFKIKEPQRIAAISNRKSGFYSEMRLCPNISFRDLDPETFKGMRNRLRGVNPNHPWLKLSDEDLLVRSGLARRDNAGNLEFFAAAVLLFGTELGIQSILPQFKIDVIVKVNDTDRYDDRKDFRINLIDAYSEIMNFIERYLPDPFFFEDGQRISLRNKIFREAVANIIIHREYFSPFHARIVIKKRTVEFTNPCNPYERGKIDTDNYETHQKNPLISKFFLQLDLVEEVGSGIYNITKYLPFYTKGTAKAEFIDDNIFKTVIPYRLATDDEPEEQKAASEPELIPQESAETTEGVRRVREYISKNYGCKLTEISRDLDIALRSVNRYVQILKLSGVIKYSGSKRYGGYVRVGYIDLSKMNGQDGTIGGTIGGTMNGTIGGVNEPEKQKIAINDTINDTIKQILRLIESDPAITRDQIADTIKISNPTVSRGINKLKQLGIIERVGSKKTGRWVIINKNFGDK